MPPQIDGDGLGCLEWVYGKFSRRDPYLFGPKKCGLMYCFARAAAGSASSSAEAKSTVIGVCIVF